MSFLDKYQGVERVNIDEEYWADLKKSLTAKEQGRVQKSVFKGTLRADPNSGKLSETEIDTSGYAIALLVAHLKEWNLGIDISTPETKQTAIENLPNEVFQLLSDKCAQLSQVRSPQEQQSFRAPADGGPEEPANQ